MVDAFREIEDLTEFRGRWPGTDAERRAARHLAGRLEDLGLDSATEPIHVWPRYHLAHLAHALLAIAGSAISTVNATLGLVLVAVALVAAVGDISGAFHLTRRLTGRRASQNVTARPPASSGRPGTLILTAHYDAARTGAAFGPWGHRLHALGRLIKRQIGPFEPFAYSLLVLLGCMVARVLGAEGNVLAAIQFAPTVVLIVTVPFLADIALSGVVPGAGDNASGVATVLRLADRYADALDSFDVWVLLPGSQEAMSLGMRAWVKRHRDELDPTSTIFLNVDSVGGGTVRYVRREGYLVANSYHPRLVQLCDRIAAEDAADDDRYGARSIISRGSSDARVARAAGLPAITVTCRDERDRIPHHHQPTDTPEHVDEEALDRAFGFCSELIELIDEEVGPLLDDLGDDASEDEHDRANPARRRARRLFTRA
jgi:hypothetical protein